MLVEKLVSAAALRGATGVRHFLQDHRQHHRELIEELQSPALLPPASPQDHAICVGLRIESLPVDTQRMLWSAFVQWQSLLPADALQSLVARYLSMAHKETRARVAPPDASSLHLASFLASRIQIPSQDPDENDDSVDHADDPVAERLGSMVYLPAIILPEPTTCSTTRKRQRSMETAPTDAATAPRMAVNPQECEEPSASAPATQPAALPSELESRVAMIAKQLTLLSLPDASTDQTANVSELATASVDVLRKVMNQVHATQQDNHDIFCIACAALKLTTTSDDALYQITSALMEASWSSRYAGLFLDAVLLPRLLAASSVISRVLLQTVLLFHKPSYSALLLDRLLVPLLAASSLGAAQGEAATRILRERCVATEQLDSLLCHVLRQCSSPADLLANEVGVVVFQNVLNMKPTLTHTTVELLVHGVAGALDQTPALYKSAKLTTLLFTLVSKHSAQCRPHVDELTHVATRLTSVMAKATLRAVQKL